MILVFGFLIYYWLDSLSYLRSRGSSWNTSKLQCKPTLDKKKKTAKIVLILYAPAQNITKNSIVPKIYRDTKIILSFFRTKIILEIFKNYFGLKTDGRCLSNYKYTLKTPIISSKFANGNFYMIGVRFYFILFNWIIWINENKIYDAYACDV